MLRWAPVVMAAIALVVACTSEPRPTQGLPAVTPPQASSTTPPATIPATATSTLTSAADSKQVLLRLSTEPTMAPYPGGTVELPPWFTLYADGHAIYLDYVLGTLEGTSIGIRHAQLSDDQVNDLITFALDDGGLADARGYYDDNDAATDQDNTVFELRSGGGGDRRVVAYGLGDTSANHPDAAIRTKLELLARRLQNFSTDIANGGGEDLGDYEPEAYLVTLDSPFGPPPNPDSVREWPWADLEPSDFATLPDQARQLTPEQTAELADDPLAAPNDLLVAHPEEGISLVRIRALLPDEVVPTH